jgi:hypothetical protein
MPLDEDDSFVPFRPSSPPWQRTALKATVRLRRSWDPTFVAFHTQTNLRAD